MKITITQQIRDNTDKWLNVIAEQRWPNGTVSINFGMLEISKTGFDVYVSFCGRFEEKSTDWTRSELEKGKNRYANTPDNRNKIDWTEFEKVIGSCVKNWIRKLSTKNKLIGIRGIAHGFDSGDLTIVYKNIA